MEVENKVMYHFHKEIVYDEIWQENKEIIIDDNFKSKFCYQLPILVQQFYVRIMKNVHLIG